MSAATATATLSPVVPREGRLAHIVPLLLAALVMPLLLPVFIPSAIWAFLKNRLRKTRFWAVIAAPFVALQSKAARVLLRDPRDAPVLSIGLHTLVYMPLLIWLAIDFSWLVGWIYLVLLIGPGTMFYARAFGARHREAHSRASFFKKPYSHVFGRFYECFFGLFYGNIINTDSISHVRVHHVEENGPEDPQSLLYYQRDRLSEFLRYCFSSILLFNLTITPALYLLKRKRMASFYGLLRGALVHVLLLVGAFAIGWRFAFIAVIMPFFLHTVVITVVQWAHHGFADPDDPEDTRANVTSVYDDLTPFNENFHYSHHVKAALHWSESISWFESQAEQIAHRDPPVFRELRFPQIVFLMVTRRFEVLARYYVALNPERRPEEVPALLQRRTARVLG